MNGMAFKAAQAAAALAFREVSVNNTEILEYHVIMKIDY